MDFNIVRTHLSLGVAMLLGVISAQVAEIPTPQEGTWLVKDFRFHTGEVLPELKLHYMTLGAPTGEPVLVLHGSTGSSRGMLNKSYAGELFGEGQPLDAGKHFIILTDALGAGKSSKPSDGMRTSFPRYTYEDMVRAQYRLVTEHLGIRRLKLVTGTSMGGMHTWMWGEMHPDFMDALMPLASVPTQISGRNRAWRRVVIDAIRNDPAWNGGDYKTQPPALRTGAEMLWLMSSNPILRQQEAPNVAKTDEIPVK